MCCDVCTMQEKMSQDGSTLNDIIVSKNNCLVCCGCEKRLTVYAFSLHVSMCEDFDLNPERIEKNQSNEGS